MTNIDERDHLVAGYLMNSGKTIYRDFFTNHFPFPYYWVNLFSFLWAKLPFYRAITVFRLTLVPLYLLTFLGIFVVLKDIRVKLSLVVSIFILAIILPAFHGNLVLSETISAIFLFGLFWLLFPITINYEGMSVGKSLLALVFTGILLWTQPLYIPLLVIPLFLCPPNKRTILALLAIVIILFPVLLFYFNGQLNQLWQQGLVFNLVTYAKMFPEQIGTGNYWLQTLSQIVKNEVFLLTHWSWSFQFFQALTHVGLIVVIIRVIIASKSKGTLFSFLLMMVILRLREVKVIPGSMFNFGIYPLMSISVAATSFITMDWLNQKRYLAILSVFITISSALTFTYPIIQQGLKPGYNYHVFWSWRQEKGELINKLSKPEENILVYPNDVDLYLFSQRMPIDRFSYWFPWLDATPEIKQERINALGTKPPAVIYFGNMEYHNDKEYYSKLFPKLLNNYRQIFVNDKPSQIWLRGDLSNRTEGLAVEIKDRLNSPSGDVFKEKVE